MIAVGHARLVARDDGIGHTVRQDAEAEHLIVSQAGHNDTHQARETLRVLSQLEVVLDPGRGEPGRQAPVDKLGPGENLANLGELSRIEESRDGQQHGGGSPEWAPAPLTPPQAATWKGRGFGRIR